LRKKIQTLIKLQEIDSRLDDLKLQKGDLPLMVAQAEEELSIKKGDRDDIKERLLNLEKDRKMFEMEVEASKEQLKKYEDQLYQVQTNKEYDAISLEIDTKKSQISDLENKILQTFDEEDSLKKQLEEVEKEIAELEKQLLEYKKELEEISQLTATEEATLLHEREKVIKDLDKTWLSRYERIRKAKGGIAVAKIERGSCGGCFSTIPPQKIVEIRESNQIYTCEYCGRILVWIED